MRMMAALAIALLVVACGQESPPASVPPPESAGEAMRKDNADIARRLEEQKAAADQQFQEQRAKEERARLVSALSAVRLKFSQTVDEAYSSTRDKMAPILAKLESVRAEAAALDANACLEPGKSRLLDGMDTALGGLKQFAAETGIQSAESQEKMKDAAQKLSTVDGELKKCH